MHHRGSSQPLRQRGFTLVELLVVIGIIAVLVGILLPVVGKVRISGQKVATQNTLNRLEQGIEAYYQDYGSYPGPFADGQLVSYHPEYATPTPAAPYLAGVGSAQLTYPDPANPTAYITFPHAPTGSENLFLGLCGGLKVNQVGVVTTFRYEPIQAIRGIGPSSLNLNVAKKSQSYLDLTTADISANDNHNPLADTSVAGFDPAWWWGSPSYATLTAPFAGDSPIYEFMDRFSKPKPILYIRAQRGMVRTGATLTNLTGFIYDPANPNQDFTTPWQYDPTQIQHAYANVGVDRAKMAQAGKVWSVDTLDYPKVIDEVSGTKTKFTEGIERYFVNETLSTGDPSAGAMSDATKVLTPVYKDKYILISAGPDGLYGTADDIRN